MPHKLFSVTITQSAPTPLEYIERHKEQFLRDYAEIVRVSEERRAHYDKLFWERSRFTPDTSMEERVAVMRQLLRERRKAEVDSNENPASGR